MSITVTSIEKKGPVIICSTDDPKERCYKLDFSEGKIYGISGKPIQSTCSIINKIPTLLSVNNSALYAALYAFTNTCNSRIIPYFTIIESLLSYPDLLASRIDMPLVSHLFTHYDGKLPKGYVAWCRKNGKKLYLDSLHDFIAEQKIQQWPRSLVDSVKKFYNGANYNLAEATEYDKELCSSLIHVINNSLKRYEINLLSDISNIISIIQRNPQLRPYLDDTKNAKTALQILQDTLNKERNEKILANEAKIIGLNGVIIDGLVIKVPSTMGDFTDEGEQQHNCVGYYYHESIANGTTLIYFLRHADNPDKSYITCRYRIDQKKTVEHRLQYNAWCDSDLFEKIDKMIASILKIQKVARETGRLSCLKAEDSWPARQQATRAEFYSVQQVAQFYLEFLVHFDD